MVTAAVVVAVVSIPFVAVLLFRPVPRRLALRYPRRRPVEAALVVLGSTLGTGIITGSLIVGDTVDRSIRASAYEQLGPIDELIAVSGLEPQAELEARFTGFSSPAVDGTISFVTAPAAVAGSAAGALGQPRAQLIEIDLDRGAAFGHDPGITGLDGLDPPPGAAVVTEDLARRIDVSVGDEIQVFAFGRALAIDVGAVAERTGVAGFWLIDQRQQAYNVLVEPGTLAAMTAGIDFAATAGIEPPTSYLAFSNAGGVEDGAAPTSDAIAAIEEVIGDDGPRVQPVKRDLLEVADEAATALSQLYFTLGMFAVAAGVLLLVNIFVMLADDRRSELGMLRAIGLRRLPLVHAFAAEGWLYSLVASVLGAFLGIGVGWVIAWRADSILTSADEQYSLSLRFTFEWATVALGLAIGLVISLVTIAATSARVSRLNVIAAIRDLPAVRRRRVRWRFTVAGFVMFAVGTLWTLVAIAAREGYGVMIGPILVLVGLGAVLARWVPPRSVSASVGLAVLAWGGVFFLALGALDITVSIPVFLVQGLAMAGAAVAIVTAYQGRVGRWLARASGGSLPVRLGLAYPIARRFRTAMTLGMFAIVILTLVYLSILSFMFRNQVDEITADLSGGFGVVVTSNPTNPVPLDELEQVPTVGAVAPLAYGFAEFVVGEDDPVAWPMTGFGPELVDAPPAMQDLGDYGSEQEAWSAVLEDPSLVIVDEFFLATGAGPPDATLDPGEQVTVVDPVTGTSRELTVAALAENDFLFNGAFYGIGGYEQVFGPRSVPSRFFVAASDQAAAVGAIRRQFLVNGADAEAVRDTVEIFLAQNTGFFTLMQQFVGAGLVVGIAGIGVIMIRAVRERRRQVGVLRALGFQPAAVGRAFLFEAGFVAVEGVLIGVAVALIGTYGLISSDNNFTEGFTWGVPWTEVLVIVAIALVTSGLAALWPARRASEIRPAQALRITD